MILFTAECFILIGFLALIVLLLYVNWRIWIRFLWRGY